MWAAWAGAVVTKKDIRGKTRSSASSISRQSRPVRPLAELGLNTTKAVMPPPFLSAGGHMLSLWTARLSWAACPHRSLFLAIGQKNIGDVSLSGRSIEPVQTGNLRRLPVSVPIQMRGHHVGDLLQCRRVWPAELAQRSAPHHHVFQGKSHFLIQRKPHLGRRIAGSSERNKVGKAGA